MFLEINILKYSCRFAKKKQKYFSWHSELFFQRQLQKSYIWPNESFKRFTALIVNDFISSHLSEFLTECQLPRIFVYLERINQFRVQFNYQSLIVQTLTWLSWDFLSTNYFVTFHGREVFSQNSITRNC